jgi:hypothetical protein
VALVKGRVVDRAGRPVSGAAIYFVAAPAPRPDIAMLSDADGWFVLALEPGKYVIGARSDPAGAGQTGIDVSDAPEVQAEIVLGS